MAEKNVKELETIRKNIKICENQEKILLKEQKELERKERSHRLIVRGALLEKHLKEPLIITDDDVTKLLEFIFKQEPVEELLNKLLDYRKDMIVHATPGIWAD